MLAAFLLRPSRTAWESPAHALALALALSPDAALQKIDATAVVDLLRTEFGEKVDVPRGTAAVAVCRSVHGAVVALERRTLKDVRPWITLDDREDVVGSAAQVEAWHDWLALGNVLQFVEPGRFHAHTCTTLGDSTPAEAAAEATPRILPAAWQEIADVSDGPTLDLVLALAAVGVPVPEAGHEVDDGEHAIDLAWPDRRIAVSVEVDDDRDTWLREHGWTVVEPETAAVRAALEGTGGR
jgi:hypothetical protein